ncbi:MAG: hypothetical protein PHV05_06710, partial [Candidatus Riflebacteria bacterium]|nr:hypothetical protein [Candidatus Riflebacteria bacterium]
RNGSNQSIMEMMDYFGPSPAEPGIVSTSGLSIGQQYDAFESLQTDFMDRNISSYLLDMVKQAGQGIFDLQKLQIEDPEAYAGEYLEYMEKQMSVLEEIMARQEEIFADESKSYEERVAALEAYEQNMEAYHQAKLDTLRLEKAQEEEEARLMAEQRQAKMESALSLVGELSQRSDKIVILHDGDSTSAIKEMMEEFANNPEVVAVLQGVLDKTEAKARFGAD